ncbi:MAG: hypothetical protein AB1899_03695 [Pseudomonadota bacterium]
MKHWILLLAILLGSPAWAEPLSASKPATLRQAVDDLTLAAANRDLVLVKVQPIDSALVKRGFEDPHVRILFIGNETAVRWAEAADARLLNLLPLRLTLMEREGRVTVLSDDFAHWLGEFDGEARAFLLAWQAELRLVLDDYERQ